MTATSRTTVALRALCAGVAILAVGEFCIATVGVQIRELPPRTDFATYYLAARLISRGESPYNAALLAREGHSIGFTHDQYPYLYPPQFALAVQPLARLSYPRARALWLLGSSLALIAALAVGIELLRAEARGLALSDANLVWTVAACFVATSLHSTSVHNDLRSGSVGVLLLLCFTVMAYGLLRRWQLAVWLAAWTAVVLKAAPLALLPWIPWRLHRRATAAIAFLVVMGVAPLLLVGATVYRDWAHALGTELGREIAWAHNQSVDALLSRFLVQSAASDPGWNLPRLKQALSISATLALAFTAVWTLRRPHRAPPLVPLELGMLVLTLLLVMKIAWVHTLAAMLFVWPVLVLVVLRAAERGLRWAVPAGIVSHVGYFLAAAHLPVLWGTHLRTWPYLLAPALPVAGMLLLWGTSVFVLAHEHDILDQAPVPGTNQPRVK